MDYEKAWKKLKEKVNDDLGIISCNIVTKIMNELETPERIMVPEEIKIGYVVDCHGNKRLGIINKKGQMLNYNNFWGCYEIQHIGKFSPLYVKCYLKKVDKPEVGKIYFVTDKGEIPTPKKDLLSYELIVSDKYTVYWAGHSVGSCNIYGYNEYYEVCKVQE